MGEIWTGGEPVPIIFAHEENTNLIYGCAIGPYLYLYEFVIKF